MFLPDGGIYVLCILVVLCISLLDVIIIIIKHAFLMISGSRDKIRLKYHRSNINNKVIMYYATNNNVLPILMKITNYTDKDVR